MVRANFEVSRADWDHKLADWFRALSTTMAKLISRAVKC